MDELTYYAPPCSVLLIETSGYRSYIPWSGFRRRRTWLPSGRSLLVSRALRTRPWLQGPEPPAGPLDCSPRSSWLQGKPSGPGGTASSSDCATFLQRESSQNLAEWTVLPKKKSWPWVMPETKSKIGSKLQSMNLFSVTSFYVCQ